MPITLARYITRTIHVLHIVDNSTRSENLCLRNYIRISHSYTCDGVCSSIYLVLPIVSAIIVMILLDASMYVYM